MSDELVRRKSVFNVITDVANSRPYKIPGKQETYSEYNEGWTDCADSIEKNMSLLHSVQPERKGRGSQLSKQTNSVNLIKLVSIIADVDM